MWKEVQRTRKKEVLSSHFVLSSHLSHSRQSVSKSSIIATVCLRFYRQSDVTLLKEFQRCLNSRYLASTSLITTYSNSDSRERLRPNQ